jgi:predicted phage terminase large subunit-like protein
MPRLHLAQATAPKKLSQEELERSALAAQELLRRRAARQRTIDFVQYVKPKYRPGAPHYQIADALDEVLRGENDRLMIFAAPRHGKSELGTRTFPALYLGTYPDREVMTASFDSPLAEEFGRDVRNIVASNRYHVLFPRVSLAADSQAKGRWKTNEEGGFLSAGIGDSAGGGSGMTGRGAHLLCIDDPFKDRSSAESEARRKHVKDWYTSTAYTRLAPGGAIVIINTRWHQDDLCGWLLEEAKKGGDQWKVVSLSCADEETGQPISVWPERYPVQALRRIMMAMGGPDSRDWVSLYGQRPSNKKGTMFKVPMIMVLPAAPADGDTVRAWDLAATEDLGTNDPSWTVGVRMTKLRNNRYVIEDVVRFRGGPEEVEASIIRTAQQDGYDVRIGLPQDPGQAGKSQAQNFVAKLAGYKVEATPESGDKLTRASPYAAQVNVGNVALVEGSWNKAYLEELAGVPSIKHMDQMDASSRAFSMLVGNSTLAIWEKLGEMA